MWSKFFLALVIMGLLVSPLLFVGFMHEVPTVVTNSIGLILTSSEATDSAKIASPKPIVSVVDKQPQTITFVGDILLARHVEYLMNLNGAQYPFKNMESILGDSPIIVGNFESAVLQNHKKTPSFVTTFSVDTKFLPLLPQLGFSHVSLANNHALDYGAITFDHTVSALESAGLQVLGHPQKVGSSSVSIFKSGNYTVGLLAINEVFSNLSYADIQTQLDILSAHTDYQIVYVHWGDEYFLVHNAAQESLAKKLIDSGADAIIGHHPHVVQDIQIYNDKPIFYSLGNFLFDQYFSVDVQQGLVVRLELSPTTASYTLVPISSEGVLSQPHLMDEGSSALFLKNLSRRSDSRYAGDIALNKLILPFLVASSS